MSNSDKRTKEGYHQYWQNPEHGSERPSQFVGSFERSKLIHDLLRDHRQTGRVLEVGCGPGANLVYLYERGYDDLAGIELNEESLSLFAEHYPDAYEATEIYPAPAEEVLPTLETDEFDAVLAVTVLAHIHPDSEFVFDELVRVARHHLLVIENESTDIDIFVPRDYGTVFSERGCTQIDYRSPEVIESHTELSANCHLRLFEVP